MENLPGKDGHYKLRDQVNWPTPRANMHEPCETRVETGKHRHNLEDYLQCEMRGLLAPDSPSTKGKSRELWMTPRASEVAECEEVAKKRMSRLSKEGRKTGGTKNLTQQTKGKLNPDWVEQLMGLPTGWTDCDYSETE